MDEKNPKQFPIYHIIESILDSEHKEIYQIMMKYIQDNIITPNMDVITLFLEDTKITEQINKTMSHIKKIISDDIYNIIKQYIVNATLAKILLVDYKQGEKISESHYVAIRLRAHNIIRKAQIEKLCNK
jgi:hypothetical protein